MIFIQNKMLLYPSPDGSGTGNSSNSEINKKNRKVIKNGGQRRVKRDYGTRSAGNQFRRSPGGVPGGAPSKGIASEAKKEQKAYPASERRIPEAREPETRGEVIAFRLKRWYDGLVMHGKFKVEVNRPAVIKAIVYGFYFIAAALLQTTVFARFNPFGAVPDLMLTSVIALALYEGEKWGAVFGIFAGYVIDAIGSTGVSLMPLVYMLFGYVCGMLTVYYLTNSFAVWVIYMTAALAGRGVVTLLYILGMYAYYPVNEAFSEIIFPEAGSTAVFSLFTYTAVRLISKPFRKRRRDNVDVL